MRLKIACQQQEDFITGHLKEDEIANGTDRDVTHNTISCVRQISRYTE